MILLYLCTKHLNPMRANNWFKRNTCLAACLAVAAFAHAQSYVPEYNDARLKVKAMQKEMPKKYWRNLPEASLIPDLIAGAEKAAKEMIEYLPRFNR